MITTKVSVEFMLNELREFEKITEETSRVLISHYGERLLAEIQRVIRMYRSGEKRSNIIKKVRESGGREYRKGERFYPAYNRDGSINTKIKNRAQWEYIARPRNKFQELVKKRDVFGNIKHKTVGWVFKTNHWRKLETQKKWKNANRSKRKDILYETGRYERGFDFILYRNGAMNGKESLYVGALVHRLLQEGIEFYPEVLETGSTRAGRARNTRLFAYRVVWLAKQRLNRVVRKEINDAVKKTVIFKFQSAKSKRK